MRRSYMSDNKYLQHCLVCGAFPKRVQRVHTHGLLFSTGLLEGGVDSFVLCEKCRNWLVKNWGAHFNRKRSTRTK